MSFKVSMAAYAVQTALSMVDEQKAREWLDDLLDKAEDAIAHSPTKMDDVTALPAIRLVRQILNIPDDIGGDPD